MSLALIHWHLKIWPTKRGSQALQIALKTTAVFRTQKETGFYGEITRKRLKSFKKSMLWLVDGVKMGQRQDGE